MLTIPAGIKDPSYRYKMPKMQLSQESRLNGVKTNIVNIDDVAEHLRVPPLALMKFFCAELGANMEKTSLIKGKHPYDILERHLDKFIRKYVICQNCKYPELKMKVEGKGDLVSNCNSCGTMNKHDSTHKAGKVFVLEFKKKGERETDIVKKDKAAADSDEDIDVKKDKKKKKAKDEDDEEDEEEKPVTKEAEVSDNDDELSIASRRIGK
jgi:translation initiation factor 5